MLLENYFHILWLDISSNQKQISKRAKEILKYLAIWEIPEFENDFYFTKNYRNENLVKLALDNLSKPKEKLINVFFWFDIESEKDKQIFTLTNEKKYEKAIELIKQQWNKKNLAIMYLLFLLESSMNKEYSKYLEESINIFKEISEDNKFWLSFEKKYLLFDDISTNKDLIKEFRKDLWKYLSNIYYDISLKLWDDNVQKIFHDNFKNTKWKKSNEQIEKITLELNKIALELEALNINDDWILSNEKKNFIKNSLNKIQDILNKTIEVWVYDSSEIIIVRDKLANTIHSISLDFYNYANDKKKGLSFLEIAINICWTEWLKLKFQEEIKIINKWIENEKEDIIKFDVHFSWQSDLIFTNDKITYKARNFKYKDIDAISFYSVKKSVNWITTWTDYSVTYYTSNDEIDISFGSSLFNSWNKEKSEMFSQIVWISMWILKPIIIEKLKKHIFINNWDYKIGDVTFNKRWYYIKKFFWWEKWVFWDDEEFWTPQLNSWSVFLYKVEKWKLKNFTNLNMQQPNAVLLPDIIPNFIEYFNNSI